MRRQRYFYNAFTDTFFSSFSLGTKQNPLLAPPRVSDWLPRAMNLDSQERGTARGPEARVCWPQTDEFGAAADPARIAKSTIAFYLGGQRLRFATGNRTSVSKSLSATSIGLVKYSSIGTPVTS